MKILTLLIAIGLLLINPGCSKTDQLRLPTYHLFDGQANPYGNSAVITNDSSVVLCGYDEDLNVVLYKTSIGGSLEWTNKLELERALSNPSLEKSKNGDLFLIGTSRINQGTSEMDIQLIKLDAEGREIWRKTYGRSNEESSCVFTSTKDNNLLIVSNSEDPLTGKIDLLILKIDKNGNTIWREIIKSPKKEVNPSHVLQTKGDKGFLISGVFNEEDGGVFKGLNILKIDSLGQKQWEVNGNKDYEWGFSATEAINGDLLVAGQNTLNGSSQASVRRYDSKGNLLWDNEYGQLESFGEQGSSIKTNFDGTFTILGKVSNLEFEREDILLFKINSNGVIMWSKTFGSDEDDWGITLLKNSTDINIITGEYKVKYESLGTKKGIKKRDGFLFITLVDSDGEFR